MQPVDPNQQVYGRAAMQGYALHICTVLSQNKVSSSKSKQRDEKQMQYTKENVYFKFLISRGARALPRFEAAKASFNGPKIRMSRPQDGVRIFKIVLNS